MNVIVSGDNKPRTTTLFTGLAPLLVENLALSGYFAPNVIQQNVISIIQAGRDLMSSSHMGSGKTAAFLIPIIHKLISSQTLGLTGSSTAFPKAIIISPTMLLATKIFNMASKLCKGSTIRPVMVDCEMMGSGYRVHAATRKIAQGCNILIVTPGLLLQKLLEERIVSFRDVEFLVLYEAESLLLDVPDLPMIINHHSMPTKDQRQTLMLSIGMDDDAQSHAQDFLKPEYLFVTGLNVAGQVWMISEQKVYMTSRSEKMQQLLDLLESPSRDPREKTLVYVECDENADFLASYLEDEGFPATLVSDFISEKECDEAFYDFDVGRKPILVATDRSIRGLYISGVDHVINYDLPSTMEDYVNHRLGYLVRAGNLQGKSSSFFEPTLDCEIGQEMAEGLEVAKVEYPVWLGDGACPRARAVSEDDEDWG